MASPHGFDISRALLEQAIALTPGGVHSNVRLDEHPFPLFYESAHGCELVDVDGNVVIDFVLGQGPLILGHSPREVLEAVRDQLDRGLLYAGQHRLELEAARMVVDLVPCAERVRFGLTGSEAIQAALRVARAETGRDLIVKFQGHYNGWDDPVQYNVGSRAGARGPDGEFDPVAESRGLAPATSAELLVVEWNDAAALERVLEARGAEVAAVLMEPMMCNAGCALPREGYLEQVRALCDRHGVVLIFDEVITGFRLAPGGAQERFGVTPDLAVFGKALAAGFPVACLAGRADLFAAVGTGKVNHAGTFNANPIGLAATVAALRTLSDPAAEVHARMERTGRALIDGLTALGAELGVPLRVYGLPQASFVTFDESPEPPRDHADTQRFDRERFRRLAPVLRDEGVRLGSHGNVFLCAVHTEAHVEQAVGGFRRALEREAA